MTTLPLPSSRQQAVFNSESKVRTHIASGAIGGCVVELKVTLDSSFKTSFKAGPAQKKSKSNAVAAAADGPEDAESFLLVRLVSNKNGRPPFSPKTVVYNVFSSDDYQVRSRIACNRGGGVLLSSWDLC